MAEKRAAAKKPATKAPTKTAAKKTATKTVAGEKAATNTAAERATPKKSTSRFTAEERAAMKERARELRTPAEDGEAEIMAKIAAMPEPDRTMAERVHAIVRAAAPDLTPRTWYGMPAYAKGGKVVCFFQDAAKFKARYATLGFNDAAKLDDGAMWPTAYALSELTAATEKQIAALVRRAAS